MNPDLLRVLLLLGAAILMFALNRPRVDAVALIMIVALPFTGVITMNEAIAGFSNPNIVLIGAMFVVGEALARTGVARRVGDRLIVWGGTRAWLLLTLLMVAVGVLGSVMSSTGVVAIFIPVVLRIASRTGIAPSQLMMPMAYAALISGTMTLVATSSNLVINYELTRDGGAGFNFFSFTPFGLPILLLGVLYMLGARRWLTASADAGVQVTRRPSLRHWVERYQLAEREYRVRVKPHSPLLGKALGVQDLRSKIGARIILIERGRGRARRLLSRTPETRLQAGDVLLLDVDTEVTDVQDLCERYAVELLPRTGFYFADQSQDVGLVEVMLPDGAAFVGKTVAEAELLAQSELSLVGVRRGRQAIAPHGVRETQLKVGDTLLLAGPWKVIRGLRGNGQDLVVLNLPKEFDEVLPAARKAPYALFTLGHGGARALHRQYRQCRPVDPHRVGDGGRAERLALSLRHDHRPGRLLRLHDPDLTGQYPGGYCRQLQLRRLHPHRVAFDPDRYGRERSVGALVIAALLSGAATATGSAAPQCGAASGQRAPPGLSARPRRTGVRRSQAGPDWCTASRPRPGAARPGPVPPGGRVARRGRALARGLDKAG